MYSGDEDFSDEITSGIFLLWESYDEDEDSYDPDADVDDGYYPSEEDL